MAERVTEIYSLLVPLVDGRLIIPRACVAEVIGFQTPSEMTGAPPWYIGTVPWNGKAVPLVSFEGTCGQMIPPASGRTRIVILLDIEMPRMDGYEVAAHVRNDPRLKDVPIIMVTSRVGEKHRARAIELGVDDYLGKPYQEAQLLDAIAPLVERRRAALRA